MSLCPNSKAVLVFTLSYGTKLHKRDKQTFEQLPQTGE